MRRHLARKNEHPIRKYVLAIYIFFLLGSPAIFASVAMNQHQTIKAQDRQIRELQQTNTEILGELKGLHQTLQEVKDQEATNSAEIKKLQSKKEEARKVATRITKPNTAPPKVIGQVANGGAWVGKVSHYSRAGCLGCSKTLTMANGEPLDDARPTIAFNQLPMNTKVLVTNLDTGKSVEATVTDTGGFNRLGRIADLTPAVANALGTKTDVTNVEIKPL